MDAEHTAALSLYAAGMEMAPPDHQDQSLGGRLMLIVGSVSERVKEVFRVISLKS